MNEEIVKEKMVEILAKYFSDGINDESLQHQICTLTDIVDVLEFENELVKECYLAIFHMTEKYCQVPRAELEYYLECLEGRSIYSNEERNKIIRLSFVESK